jgi:hypothetical protein
MTKIFFNNEVAKTHNQCFQLTVKSVTKFAMANFPPLFTSAEAGVSLAHKINFV